MGCLFFKARINKPIDTARLTKKDARSRRHPFYMKMIGEIYLASMIIVISDTTSLRSISPS